MTEQIVEQRDGPEGEAPQDHAPPGPSRNTARGVLSAALDVGRRTEDWIRDPASARRLVWVALPLLIVGALLLPPISVINRFMTRGHARVLPGASVSIRAQGDPAAELEIRRGEIQRPSRISLHARETLPRGVGPLPAGQAPISRSYQLDVKGPPPLEGRLSVALPIGPDAQPFVDPYGWDGERWRWLPTEFTAANRVRISLPLVDFVPNPVVVTLARSGATEMSAVLLPPPARAPAAAAGLPSVELRSYRLADVNGDIERRNYPPMPIDTRRTAIVDDREGPRVRQDLVTNVLIQPDARRRHREVLVRHATDDRIDGLVLDYQGIPDDLQRQYVAMIRLLSKDLAKHDIDLAVVVPMPRWDGESWDSGAVNWQGLGASASVRVRLPDDRPIELNTLDSMVRWALQQVDRRHLQLALPVWGRDIVDDEVIRVGFGESLERVLSMARSDAPRRLSPGRETEVELPAIGAAELGRDSATGMWRFSYWDTNRRQHTVWLNDADGLAAAFEVAAHYRLGRLALDGVSASNDPRVWNLVSAFIENGRAEAPDIRYMLRWQLIDSEGRVVEESMQAVDDAIFRFTAPAAEGKYRLSVDLVTGDGALAAVGIPLPVLVAPAPPPSPTPTTFALRVLPTPESYATVPPPIDEIGVTRTPVRVGATAAAGTLVPEAAWNAEISFAEASLRSEPRVSSELLSDLRRGDRLLILEREANGDWLRVRVTATGIEGWVLARLVTDRPPTEEPTSTQTPDVISDATPASGETSPPDLVTPPTGKLRSPTPSPSAVVTPGAPSTQVPTTP